MALAAARRKTPPVARRWGYLMDMGLDSFASAFAKHIVVHRKTMTKMPLGDSPSILDRRARGW